LTEVRPEKWRDVRELQDSLGYEFERISLLELALQHSSFAHETADCESNERLEFLGDAVLGVVVAQVLYQTHPDWDEGALTLGLQNLVDQRSLAKLGRVLDLGSYLRLGRTERQSAGNEKPGILSDAVEAILAAMYLDGGIDPVARLLKRVFAAAFASDAPRVQRDPKTRLQELVMADRGIFPTYLCVGNTEIDGDENRFTVQVQIDEKVRGEGIARSKRLAERNAAIAALADMGGDGESQSVVPDEAARKRNSEKGRE
jgi:ribonuclease-3